MKMKTFINLYAYDKIEKVNKLRKEIFLCG